MSKEPHIRTCSFARPSHHMRVYSKSGDTITVFLQMFSPNSSKVLFKIFKDSNIYTAKSKRGSTLLLLLHRPLLLCPLIAHVLTYSLVNFPIADGTIGPSTNTYAGQQESGFSFSTCILSVYQSVSGVYTGKSWSHRSNPIHS